MLSRVERFENDALWKRCFVVWTEKTMLSENGDVIKIDMTGRQITRPRVSKMADKRYHMASILRADILKCACVEFIWACALRVQKRFQNGYGVVVWTGENDTKTISVDKSFRKRSKTASFLFENGLVWMGPKSDKGTIILHKCMQEYSAWW